MKKRFRKKFDNLEFRLNRDLDAIHTNLLYRFRISDDRHSMGGIGGGGGGGGTFVVPKTTSYVIVACGSGGGGGGSRGTYE